MDEEVKDACTFGTFLRNIRSLYPRCSYLKLLPRVKYCDKNKKEEEEHAEEAKYFKKRKAINAKCKRQENPIKHQTKRNNEDSLSSQGYPSCFDHREGGHYQDRNYEKRVKHERDNDYQEAKYHYNDGGNANLSSCQRTENLVCKNCKTCNLEKHKFVGMQAKNQNTRSQRDITKKENLKEKDCCRKKSRLDRDYMSFCKKNQVYYVGQCRDSNAINLSANTYDHSSSEGIQEKIVKKCICQKCGFVHQKIVDKNEKNFKNNINYGSCNFPKEKEKGFQGKNKKTKTNSPKSSKSKLSIFQKLKDVRLIKVCEGKTIKPNKKPAKNKSSSQTSCSKKYQKSPPSYTIPSNSDPLLTNHPTLESPPTETEEEIFSIGQCDCKPKLKHIEERLRVLEQVKVSDKKETSEEEGSESVKQGKSKEKRKREKKHRNKKEKKKKCHKKEKSEEEISKKEKKKKRKKCKEGEGEVISCESDYRNKKNKAKNTRRKKHKKRNECEEDEIVEKTKSWISEKETKEIGNDEKSNKVVMKSQSKDQENKLEVAAFYCTCLSPKGTPADNALREAEKMDSGTNLKSESQKVGSSVKRKLSSFQSFWKQLRKSKKEGKDGRKSELRKLEVRDDGSSNLFLINDCSKSSSVPKMREVYTIQTERVPLNKKSSKKKHSERKKKEKEPKSKPKSKRHT